MFTKRCSVPSLTRRPLMPPWFASRLSITSASVVPLASTVFSPPVWVRRMVGMETVTAMETSARERDLLLGQRLRRRVVFRHDVDRLLGDLAVHDAERPQLVGLRVARRDQHVVGLRLRGVGHVGA